MMRKLSPEKAAIIEWIRESGTLDKREIYQRCRATMGSPDPVKLENHYWNRVANSMVSAVRDADNTREAFPVESRDGTKVCVISSTTDVLSLQRIDERLEKQIKGATRSRSAVQMRMAELAGQANLGFEEAEKNEEKPSNAA